MLRTISIDERFSELEKVEALALEAFPPEEYLAPGELIRMAAEDGFDFLALYDENVFVGFMVVMTHKTMAYLFFLAIEKSFRSMGYGSKALRTLRAIYPNMQQVVDMEKQDDSAANQRQREKRRQFYIRNGYQATGTFLSYLGVDYEVLCMDDDFDLALFKELMRGIRIPGFAPRYFAGETESTHR